MESSYIPPYPDGKELDHEMCKYGLHIKNQEMALKIVNDQTVEVEQVLFQLQDPPEQHLLLRSMNIMEKLIIHLDYMERQLHALHGSWMALPLASASLSTWEDPTRFYGFDLDEHHVYTRTDRGDGLRETLSSQLFGKTC
ncbi:hypothetical protein Pint_27469 [Pistacia integerrima]|uniref:Uncharacterized protein n=1 Tax=Pistacia integerrima TaxID=434235 RepID=A0ACC0YTL4_9ROSI|nr:hypothetical protein Pint_27469 [Pistacia integerrima]